jgi:hypothetical protein
MIMIIIIVTAFTGTADRLFLSCSDRRHFRNRMIGQGVMR